MVKSVFDIISPKEFETDSSRIAEHLPCHVYGGCGSSDAMAIYKNDSSGRYSFYCFSCGKAQSKGITEDLVNEVMSISIKGFKTQYKDLSRGLKHKGTSNIMDQVNNVVNLSKGTVREIQDRGIRESVCKRYGVRTQLNKNTQEIATHIYPYTDSKGNLIAQKIRLCPKNGFPWESNEPDYMNKIVLFGQHIFTPGQSTKLTITEGEIDAMSAFQLNGELYPVVSIPSGGGKNVKNIFKNDAVYKFVDSFKEIVISMDMDDNGELAAKIIAEIFPRKSKIMNMRYKDANEYLLKGTPAEWTKDFHNAQTYAPQGLIKSSALIKPLLEGEAIDTCGFYPYKQLNHSLIGVRGGELVTITAGTGVGKSDFTSELALSLQQQTGEPVGLVFLEQSKTKTAAKLLSKRMNKPIANMNLLEKMPEYLKKTDMYKDLVDHMNKSGQIVKVPQEEIQKEAEALFKDDKFILFEHFGSTDIDTVLQKVYQMKTVFNCKFVFLDHISIVVSGQDSGDERKALDAIMTKLRMLVEQTGLCLFVVSHLKRPPGKGHEQGAEVSLSELRGTAGIGQLSDVVIGLERNQQHEDPYMRNITITRVLKNRMFGDTGPSSILFFDKTTARLKEVSPEEYEENIKRVSEKEQTQANLTKNSWEEVTHEING
jgi:twinkle protein